jgi:hypothetical protein
MKTSHNSYITLAPGAVFTTLHFLRNSQMDPIRFCCITLCWKVLPWTNTLAYWSHSWVMKKVESCESDSLFSSWLMNWPNKLEYLSLAGFSNLVLCLQVSAKWVKHLSCAQPGNTKGEGTIDHLFDQFGLVCLANKNKNCKLSYSWFQTSQTGGQPYSDASPFSIPWLNS